MMPPVKDDQNMEQNQQQSQSQQHQQQQSSQMQHLSDQQQQQPIQAQPPGLTKAELRKNNKPIMEKKRRARINHCLNELKTLILEAMQKDPSRHTKLEKADILEMTVKYLQNMQRNQLTMAAQADPTVIHKFKAGFSDCTDEVNRYINQIDGIDSGVKQRLIGHLNNCVTGIQQVVTPYSYTNNYRNNIPFTNGNSIAPQSNAVLPISQDLNHDGRIQMGGVQLIPSRLPTGELALVMPNSSNLPYFPTFPTGQSTLDLSSTCAMPRVSAFNKPKTHAKHLSTDSSPPMSPASSMSSGDDSLAQSEYQSFTTTPPLQQQNMLNAFPTPPSGGSITMVSVAKTQTATATLATLQQPQVTSTTEPPNSSSLKVKPLSVITNTATNTPTSIRPEIQYVNKKRPYPVDINSDNGLLRMVKSEPLEKISRLSEPVENQNGNKDDKLNNNINMNNINDDDNSGGDMWRPWLMYKRFDE